MTSRTALPALSCAWFSGLPTSPGSPRSRSSCAQSCGLRVSIALVGCVPSCWNAINRCARTGSIGAPVRIDCSTCWRRPFFTDSARSSQFAPTCCTRRRAPSSRIVFLVAVGPARLTASRMFVVSCTQSAVRLAAPAPSGAPTMLAANCAHQGYPACRASSPAPAPDPAPTAWPSGFVVSIDCTPRPTAVVGCAAPASPIVPMAPKPAVATLLANCSVGVSGFGNTLSSPRSYWRLGSSTPRPVKRL